MGLLTADGIVAGYTAADEILKSVDLTGALAAPLAAEAQPGGITRRLGVLHIQSERNNLSWAFFNELRDQGWVEGRNLIVTERFLKMSMAGTRRTKPVPRFRRLPCEIVPPISNSPVRLMSYPSITEALVPSVFLATTVLAVNMLGDGLRDLLDPRARTQS